MNENNSRINTKIITQKGDLGQFSLSDRPSAKNVEDIAVLDNEFTAFGRRADSAFVNFVIDDIKAGIGFAPVFKAGNEAFEIDAIVTWVSKVPKPEAPK